jgi:hypothetical protein
MLSAVGDAELVEGAKAADLCSHHASRITHHALLITVHWLLPFAPNALKVNQIKQTIKTI